MRTSTLTATLFCVCILSACGSAGKNRVAGTAAFLSATVAPSDDILQTYYLGVFDPKEQLPQTIYRIRVRGQSAFLNTTKFASGWVPSSLIDTLDTKVSFEKNNVPSPNPNAAQAANNTQALPVSSPLSAGHYSDRRFVMFGPEGLREAPKDHRLVIVMGADPKAFFSAVDESLGSIAESELYAGTDILKSNILSAWVNATTLKIKISQSEPKK